MSLAIEGKVTAEGSLELDRPIQLPEGRVRITIQPIIEGNSPRERFHNLLAFHHKMHDGRQYDPESAAAVAAVLKQDRDDLGDQDSEIERIQLENYRRRQAQQGNDQIPGSPISTPVA
jgi:hypothetical protein